MLARLAGLQNGYTARFLVNASEPDRDKAPKLLCRPLVCLRIELAQSRIATGTKLKSEWERRARPANLRFAVLPGSPPCPEGEFSWVCNRCARRRSTDNATAVDVLHANEQLWRSVHGPAPEDLFKPTPEALAEARRAADDLESMAASQQHFRDGFDVFAQETVEAARALRSLDWSAIHAEKFHITPQPVLRNR